MALLKVISVRCKLLRCFEKEVPPVVNEFFVENLDRKAHNRDKIVDKIKNLLTMGIAPAILQEVLKERQIYCCLIQQIFWSIISRYA